MYTPIVPPFFSLCAPSPASLRLIAHFPKRKASFLFQPHGSQDSVEPLARHHWLGQTKPSNRVTPLDYRKVARRGRCRTTVLLCWSLVMRSCTECPPWFPWMFPRFIFFPLYFYLCDHIIVLYSLDRYRGIFAFNIGELEDKESGGASCCLCTLTTRGFQAKVTTLTPFGGESF